MDKYEKTISEIYAAALEPERWSNVLQVLASNHPGIGTSFMYYHGADRSQLQIVDYGYPETMKQEFLAYYHKINPFAEEATRVPVGTPVGPLNLANFEECKKSEFFNDFLLKNNFGAGANVVVSRDEKSFMHMTTDFEYRRIDQEQLAVENTLKAIAPHLGNAFEIMKRLDHGNQWQKSAFDTIGLFRDPAILVDGDLKIIAQNKAAQEFLGQPSGIRMKDSVLAFSDMKTQAFVETSARLIHQGQLHALPRQHVFASPIGRLLLKTWPIPDREAKEATLYRLIDLPPSFTCILIRNLDAYLPFDLKPAAAIFGLTPAELKLAAALVSGDELESYAVANSLSIHTVRNQLRSIFAKTDVSKQTHLIRLLMRVGV